MKVGRTHVYLNCVRRASADTAEGATAASLEDIGIPTRKPKNVDDV